MSKDSIKNVDERQKFLTATTINVNIASLVGIKIEINCFKDNYRKI